MRDIFHEPPFEDKTSIGVPIPYLMGIFYLGTQNERYIIGLETKKGFKNCVVFCNESVQHTYVD